MRWAQWRRETLARERLGTFYGVQCANYASVSRCADTIACNDNLVLSHNIDDGIRATVSDIHAAPRKDTAIFPNERIYHGGVPSISGGVAREAFCYAIISSKLVPRIFLFLFSIVLPHGANILFFCVVKAAPFTCFVNPFLQKPALKANYLSLKQKPQLK